MGLKMFRPFRASRMKLSISGALRSPGALPQAGMFGPVRTTAEMTITWGVAPGCHVWPRWGEYGNDEYLGRCPTPEFQKLRT